MFQVTRLHCIQVTLGSPAWGGGGDFSPHRQNVHYMAVWVRRSLTFQRGIPEEPFLAFHLFPPKALMPPLSPCTAPFALLGLPLTTAN